MLRSMTEVERQASGLNVLAEVRANLQAGLDPLERPTNARAARANDGDAATVRLSAGRSRTPGAASSLCFVWAVEDLPPGAHSAQRPTRSIRRPDGRDAVRGGVTFVRTELFSERRASAGLPPTWYRRVETEPSREQQGQALEFPLSRYARRRYGRHFRCLPLGRSESSRLLIGSRMTRAYLG